MTFVSRSDAVVALRSFARRYPDVLAGPKDDDAWERLVRASAPGKRSAAGEVAHAVGLLDQLAAVLQAIPTHASLSVTSSSPSATRSGLGESAPLDALVSAVKAAATSAADALDHRRDEDYDRQINAGGKTTTVATFVSDTVNTLANGVRDASAAINAAQHSRHGGQPPEDEDR